MGLMTRIFENGLGGFFSELAAFPTVAALAIDVRFQAWFTRANFRRF